VRFEGNWLIRELKNAKATTEDIKEKNIHTKGCSTSPLLCDYYVK